MRQTERELTLSNKLKRRARTTLFAILLWGPHARGGDAYHPTPGSRSNSSVSGKGSRRSSGLTVRPAKSAIWLHKAATPGESRATRTKLGRSAKGTTFGGSGLINAARGIQVDGLSF